MAPGGIYKHVKVGQAFPLIFCENWAPKHLLHFWKKDRGGKVIVVFLKMLSLTSCWKSTSVGNHNTFYAKTKPNTYALPGHGSGSVFES